MLDTNILSEVMRPRPSEAVLAWLAGQDGRLLFFSAIGEAELRAGVEALPPGRRKTGLVAAIDGLVTIDFKDRVLPFDRKAAQAYGEIAAARRKAGRPISAFDGQVAAIARSLGAAVATRNVKDFAGCGVEVIDPWVAQ